MASAAQIEANRSNAKLSAGPTTPEGKARSSRNATTHGLSAAEVVLFPGEEPEFQALRDGLYNDLRPFGDHQTQLFNEAVYHAWNRRRARRLIAALAAKLGFDPAASPLVDPRVTPEISREYERLSRHLRHHNAGYNRSVRDLSKAQTELSVRLAISPKNVSLVPPLAMTAEIAERTQPTHTLETALGYVASAGAELGLDQSPYLASRYAPAPLQDQKL
jgi:hypothetical protein